MRVLVVDDSLVFRSRIQSALARVPGVEVVGTVANGQAALERLRLGGIDLITLDLEMPVLGGLETLKRIRSEGLAVKVVIFSTLTRQGAAEAMEALRLGADDVVEKPVSGNDTDAITGSLVPKVTQFLPRPRGGRVAHLAPDGAEFPAVDLHQVHPKVVLIASSTGGPQALHEIFSSLRGPVTAPILIVQHMPPVFTRGLAERLEATSGISAKEAEDGEVLMTNRIYVAPGDCHMRIQGRNGGAVIVTDQGPLINHVRPAADPLFESAAALFGPRVLALVLTGMGEDGARGAVAVKRAGGGVMIQEEATCVVAGMPRAVSTRGAYDRIGTLEEISRLLQETVAGGTMRRSA